MYIIINIIIYYYSLGQALGLRPRAWGRPRYRLAGALGVGEGHWDRQCEVPRG